MTRREARISQMDVLKYFICKLNCKEIEVGPSKQLPLLSMRSKAQAAKFSLVGVCFLPRVPLGWDAVVRGVATRLHGWNQDISLSFSLILSPCPALRCTHHRNVHTTLLSNLSPKFTSSWLFHGQHTFSGMAIVW